MSECELASHAEPLPPGVRLGAIVRPPHGDAAPTLQSPGELLLSMVPTYVHILSGLILPIAWRRYSFPSFTGVSISDFSAQEREDTPIPAPVKNNARNDSDLIAYIKAPPASLGNPATASDSLLSLASEQKVCDCLIPALFRLRN